MGKAAGYWKKIKDIAKKVGGTIGKVVSWGNTNLFKPLKPLLQPAIEMLDPTGIGKKILNIGGQAADYISDQYNKATGYQPGNNFSQIVDTGVDFAMDTQRYGGDKRYRNVKDYVNRIPRIPTSNWL